MPADLHLHTFYSDGTQSPQIIVELAAKNGLTTIAITDHDVVTGIDPAIEVGKKVGVEVIAGIEFTTEALNTEVHILGYFVDYYDQLLLTNIDKIQHGRESRIFKICEKLKNLGVEIQAEEVFALAGHRAPGRPHVARVLVKKGFVSSIKEAFDRYLDFHGPAYVSHYKLSPAEAIKLVLGAKGLPVYAHPASSNCDQIIPDLMAAGLVGLEVYYFSHNQSQVKHYQALAKKYGLLLTGGSDYHGAGSGRDIELGNFSIPDNLVKKLKDEYLRRNMS
jgi:predicted metal-dependent phosphoesterase TrpH